MTGISTVRKFHTSQTTHTPPPPVHSQSSEMTLWEKHKVIILSGIYGALIGSGLAASVVLTCGATALIALSAIGASMFFGGACGSFGARYFAPKQQPQSIDTPPEQQPQTPALQPIIPTLAGLGGLGDTIFENYIYRFVPELVTKAPSRFFNSSPMAKRFLINNLNNILNSEDKALAPFRLVLCMRNFSKTNLKKYYLAMRDAAGEMRALLPPIPSPAEILNCCENFKNMQNDSLIKVSRNVSLPCNYSLLSQDTHKATKASGIKKWMQGNLPYLGTINNLDLRDLEMRCIPQEIRLFERLSILRLSNNQLTMLPPDVFKGCANTLVYLHLNNNPWTFISFKKMPLLPALLRITINTRLLMRDLPNGRIEMTDLFYDILEKAPKLQVVYLFGEQLKWEADYFININLQNMLEVKPRNSGEQGIPALPTFLVPRTRPQSRSGVSTSSSQR